MQNIINKIHDFWKDYKKFMGNWKISNILYPFTGWQNIITRILKHGWYWGFNSVQRKGFWCETLKSCYREWIWSCSDCLKILDFRHIYHGSTWRKDCKDIDGYFLEINEEKVNDLNKLLLLTNRVKWFSSVGVFFRKTNGMSFMTK